MITICIESFDCADLDLKFKLDNLPQYCIYCLYTVRMVGDAIHDD